MLKEFKHVFSQKYLLILIVFFVFCVVAAISMANDVAEDKNVNFCYDVEKYENIQEIRARYEKLDKEKDKNALYQSKELSEDYKNYYKQLYSIIIENNLPYDSLVEFQDATYSGMRKNTHFHLYGMSAFLIMIFMLYSSFLIGSVVPTIDFTKKTAKLVYTTGEKKDRILMKKYIVSLGGLLISEIALELLAALFSQAYSGCGVEYCFWLVGRNIILMNFGQFMLLHIAHNALWLVLTYTIVYYFSFLCKNTIIASLSVFSMLLLNSLITIRFKHEWAEILYNMPTAGLFGCYVGAEGIADYKYMLFGFIYLALSLILFAASMYAVKKFDFSR